MTVRWRVAIVALLALAAGVLAPAAQASGPDDRAGMLQLLEAVRSQYSAPGAGFTYGDGGGDDVSLSRGTGDILTGQPIRSSDEVRVGSNTKMYVSVVTLLLVGEGRLDLDVPIEQYLPGALRYPAGTVPGDPADYDGRTVTLRQLLQHTSGIPDYAADTLYVLNPLHQIVPPKPQDLVHYGVRNGPSFRPGARFHYSNTEYTLVGMIVEATTGRSLAAEIHDRIVEPLGLHHTFFAETGQRGMTGPHVHGYLTALVPLDMTYFEPAVWGAAGALVSSADDMNTFNSALLAGELLPPDLLAEMLDEVPYNTGGYGLGLVRFPLSCGDAYGHAGYLAGYETFGLAMPGGRHAFLTLNTSLTLNLIPPAVPVSAYDLFERAFC